MEQECNLGGPGPIEQEGDGYPGGQPDDLVDAHNDHTALGPGQEAIRGGSSEESLEGQRDGCAGDHEKVANG